MASKPATPAATEWVLRGPGGHEYRLVLDGAELVTVALGNPVTQRFDDEATAREHVERVLMLRRHEGYVLERTRAANELPAALTAEQTSLGLEYDAATGRLQSIFEDEASNGARIAALTETLKQTLPRVLRVRCDPGSPGDALAGAFYRAKLPSVRALVLDTEIQTQTRQGPNRFGDLRVMLEAMPNLERVFATGDLQLSPLRHAKLRELHLSGDPLPAEVIETLGRCRLPALEILALSCASDASPAATDEDVVAAVRRLESPKLSMVVLSDVADVTATLEALTREPLPPDWRRLGVGGGVRDEGALLALLAERAPVLRNVSLILPLEDLSSAPEQRRDFPVKLEDDDAPLRDEFLPKAYADW